MLTDAAVDATVWLEYEGRWHVSTGPRETGDYGTQCWLSIPVLHTRFWIVRPGEAGPGEQERCAACFLAVAGHA